MPEATELAGFLGAGLAGVAYIPQIWHLISAHCSAGLSRLAFATWLTAAALITVHAIASGAVVFVVLGAIQLVATTLVLLYTTKYRHSYCSSHSPTCVDPRPPSVHTHSGQALNGADSHARVAARARAILVGGTLIDDRHEIDQLVGRGGMADVFRARDVTTGRMVAIKILRAVDPQSMSRFRTERDVLSRLDHPAVVRLCDTGTHDGVPYLVLELVDGPTLAEVLAHGPLDIDQAISIAHQLAQALTHAHSRDITHRDLKPANVVLDADRVRVHLADFGIAMFSDTARITATGTCIGTPAYLAPEQLEGHVDPASDVYALGLVVLECLTGTHCYAGTIADTALARLHQPPSIPDDLPPWLQHTLRAMTARHPHHRPPAQATAAAFYHRTVDAVLATTQYLDLTARSTDPPPGTEPNRTPATSTSYQPEERLTA
jgi:hypothetical protein